MSSSFVTQCPHCRTRFRVNHAQLGAANGAVRCGACMHVFDAARHLIGDQPVARSTPSTEAPIKAPGTATQTPRPAPTQPAKAVHGTPAGKAPSDTLWIHDDLDLDDLDLDEELAKLERQEMQFSKDFLALEKAPEPAQAFLSAETVPTDPHDERWAEALLHENSSTQSAPPGGGPLEPSVEKTTSAEPFDTGDPAVAGAMPNPDAEQAQADEPAWPEDTDRQSGPDAADPSDQPFVLSRRSEPALAGNGNFQLVDEPLQLDWRPPARRRNRWLLWSLLNLLALGLLAGQYVHRHFDELARQDQYRPWLEQLCPLLGCELPSKVDISQIKSSNLMVRAHPEFAGALVVDAIIYNRAPFAQPFPLLEMRFADLRGKLLASRRFKPAEYLAGELAGQTEMPSQTPIRISLEILDPGRNAENYSLGFQSPE